MEPNRELIKTYIFKNYRYSYGTTETFFKDIFLFKNNSINLFIKENYLHQICILLKSKIPIIRMSIVLKKFLSLLNTSFNKRYLDLKDNVAFLLSGGLNSPLLQPLDQKILNYQLKHIQLVIKIKKKI